MNSHIFLKFEARESKIESIKRLIWMASKNLIAYRSLQTKSLVATEGGDDKFDYRTVTLKSNHDSCSEK